MTDKIVLVVAAHSDDEALGCGGTIAKHVHEGDTVHTIFLTDGVSSRDKASSTESTQRSLATSEAQNILGVKKYHMLKFPDNQLDTVPLLEVVKKLERIIDDIGPQIIYTHSELDLNVDHQIAYRAVVTACRPYPGNKVKEIYCFEVLSSTEWNNSSNGSFRPDRYVDITKHLDTKMKAINCYKNEMREIPHARSYDNVLNLAKYRGNSVGLKYAEVFQVIRVIED